MSSALPAVYDRILRSAQESATLIEAGVARRTAQEQRLDRVEVCSLACLDVLDCFLFFVCCLLLFNGVVFLCI